IYAVRETGTDLFLTTPLQNTVNDLVQLRHDDFFTKKGYHILLHENFFGYEMFYMAEAIKNRATNKLYFHGKQGRVIQVTKNQMNEIIKQEVDKPIDFLKSMIKTDPKVRIHIKHLMSQM
ncbi:MAG: hypothetical protein KGY50_05250, partial [Candidatus Thermoplasmatota archaeon]|nr:hypothetical protein [Candidatus Thermoplasmatota archaeon]